MISSRHIGVVVASTRIALGVSIWLAPKQAARAIALARGSQSDGLTEYVARIAGARDIALGAGMLLAPAEQKRQWLLAGGACDGADLAAGVIAGATRKLSTESAVAVSGAALGGVLLTALALSDD